MTREEIAAIQKRMKPSDVEYGNRIYRDFAGKEYRSTGVIYHRTYWARIMAEYFRVRGHKARIGKVKGGWQVFARKGK